MLAELDVTTITMPARTSCRAYAGLPNKRRVSIDNSFHFIQLDQSDAFDKEVQKFLNQ